MDAYHKVFMWAMRLSTREKTNSTWTFHKGMLRLVGLDWINPAAEKTFFRFLYSTVYPTFYISLQYIVAGLTLEYALSKMVVVTKVDNARYLNAFIASSSFMSCGLKAILLKIYGEKRRNLMDMIDDLGELDEIGIPHRDFGLRVARLYSGLLFSTPVAWTAYFVTFQDDVPFATDYPWSDPQENTTFTFILSFVMDFFTACFTTQVHIIFDTMFPVCVSVVAAHIAQLNAKLEKLGSRKEGINDRELLRECHILHVKILKVAKAINDNFRPMFLFQSVYSVLHACIIIYQVMKINEVALALLNTAPILCSSYAQLLTYCFFGQLFTDSFEKLKCGVYDNLWYSCELRLKKNLTIITLMANRPVQLNSYGITIAAHPTYLSSVQDSISYYLILKTVTAERE